ncbi:MAG: CCA tRNA nucleotidyltransferase [Mariprofundaceae bacterium]
MSTPDVATHIRSLPESLHRLCQCIMDAGGCAWLVGGSVRDLLLGIAPKDFDLEVYGLDTVQLKQTIQKLGRCEEVGKQFGVLKLWTDGLEFDLALPRSESKQGRGHRGFDIVSNPHMDPQTASQRRDFTINAMMINPLDNEFLDFHRGQKDLANGVLRHVSAAFSEDPLRPLRAMQFAARFRLTLDAQTAELCRELLTEAETLPGARIWEEWRKWAHAPHPSFGLDVLQQSGWLDLYPQLKALMGCPQDPTWHPEGDVWTHTRLVVDCAAVVAKRYAWRGEKCERLLFAALCHDLGKPETTFKHESGRIRSSGHSEQGIEPSIQFLRSVRAPQPLKKHILPLVREHLVHLHGDATARAIRRLAHRLEPSNIDMWEALAEADASGRSPLPPARPAMPWLTQAKQINVEHTAPESLASGAMLLKMGMQPGPNIGALLKTAYQAQLDGEFTDAESARQWLADKLGKN